MVLIVSNIRKHLYFKLGSWFIFIMLKTSTEVTKKTIRIEVVDC
jgi:hypothetical protein